MCVAVVLRFSGVENPKVTSNLTKVAQELTTPSALGGLRGQQ